MKKERRTINLPAGTYTAKFERFIEDVRHPGRILAMFRIAAGPWVGTIVSVPWCGGSVENKEAQDEN